MEQSYSSVFDFKQVKIRIKLCFFKDLIRENQQNQRGKLITFFQSSVLLELIVLNMHILYSIAVITWWNTRLVHNTICLQSLYCSYT